MTTPICDFVRRYAESHTLRLHMPGHKGAPLLGFEALDITEIPGADSLYEADGIIRESEQNAGRLFGAHTLYSTEGSSLCIRAMVYLLTLRAREEGKRPHILAGRNSHKVFLSAAALLDTEVSFLYPPASCSYLSCPVDAKTLGQTLDSMAEPPTAVYLTSPDYLGNTVDIAAIARICHARGILLAIDNAHGAYLKFLPVSRHPMDLGADICCDSAHKTLPTLTGGAYLHISEKAPATLRKQAKNALALFGSTSPSYLILQSLDITNRYLADDYPTRLAAFTQAVEALRKTLAANGYPLCGDEPLKLTLAAKHYGYTGTELADLLRSRAVECEFADPDFVVLMLSPSLSEEGLRKVEKALLAIPRRTPITQNPPTFRSPEQVMSPRAAALSPCETVPAKDAEGRILASATVSCPPAVPIVVSGERIDRHALDCFAYYAIETCTVVKE